jgi:adenosylcobinamide kinase/adenosylcobinamide-phosphate guanylyltransferase
VNKTSANVELILGGARSGKSSYAEARALDSGLTVKYIATATVHDEEMAQRVLHHQQQRPAHWQVIEEPLALAEVIRCHSAPDTCLLVDCLTLWLSNSLFGEHDLIWAEAKAQLLDALKQVQGPVILVSNEVGQGIVPVGEMSRRFVDEAGWLHQAIARQADRVVFVTAGLPQLLKG